MDRRFTILALAFVASLPAFAAPPRTALQSSAWTATAPGVYRKIQQDGTALEMHVGAEGQRIDRARLSAELAATQHRLQGPLDAKTFAQLRDQASLLQRLIAATDRAQSASVDSGSAAKAGMLATLISGHQYSYHDQSSASVCGYIVDQNADMATDAMPGSDNGYAQVSVSWRPDVLHPTSYRLSVGGYARASNDLGSSLKSLGAYTAYPGTSQTVTSQVASVGSAFGCMLETYTQISGPLVCNTASSLSYVSMTRTKHCFDLWH